MKCLWGKVGNMTNEPERLVRIPVRVHGDRLEYFYGGPLPEVCDGAIADLVLGKGSLKNPDDLKRFNEKRTVPFLSKGTLLLMLLKPSPITPERLEKLLACTNEMPWTPGWTHAAEVVLQQTQYLEFRGSKQARLSPVKCQVVPLNREAQSLNHAYTMLSAFFEKQRRSHAGNVFQLAAFFDQGLKRWRTLDELREQLMPLYEQRLAQTIDGGIVSREGASE